MLKELQLTQRELKKQNDDLAELRRRVSLTENNLYLYMHSVGTIRHCLETTKGGDTSSIMKILRSSQKGIITQRDIKKVKKSVDIELGVEPEFSNSSRTHGNATKHQIMNSLISITGRMSEFSDMIGKSFKTVHAGHMQNS